MLELGCGDNPRVAKDCTHYVGMDASQHALEIAGQKLQNYAAAFDPEAFSFSLEKRELGFQPLNYPESTFDFVLGDQFLEHVPRVAYSSIIGPFNPVIRLLNDVCRLARPNALVQFNVPKWNSQEMWQDPTHCNPVPPNFWIYWDPADQWGIKASYGIQGSLRLEETVDCGWYHIFKLRNVK
jgi:hypothetical protein